MKSKYDWNRLGPYWWHDENKNALVYCSQDGKGDASYLVSHLESVERVLGAYAPSDEKLAIEQLTTCRIPAPDMATVTELRPRDEYDWSRLEGSGWRHANEDECITDGTWTYWYTAENSERLQTSCVFAVEDAARAQERAADLVAKCKRDWRDEVEQACEGIDGLAELTQEGNKLFLRAVSYENGFSMRFTSDRTFGLIDGVQTLEWVLKLSVIIERLKKRGWREA